MYRIIDFIGRWSMLDLFVISLMVALVDRGVLLNVRAGPGRRRSPAWWCSP